MKRPLYALLGLSSLAWFLQAAEPSFQLPAERVELKPGPGREQVQGNCLICHSADYISTQPPLNRVQWKAIVVKMQQKYGAPLTTNQLDPIVNYLATQYGRETK